MPGPVTSTSVADRGTVDRGTSNRGTVPPQRDPFLDRGIGLEEKIPLTKTSMTTDAPPLEQRAQTPPKYSLIVKKIDVFQLAGTNVDPDAEIEAASKIWSQCGIEFEIVSRQIYDEAKTRKLLATAPEDAQKPLIELTVVVDPDEATPSMENLRSEWSKNKRATYAVFFAPKVRLKPIPAPSAADPHLDIVYIGKNVGDYWPGWVVAHELGHRLIGPQFIHDDLCSSLMRPNRPGNEIVELECRAARGDDKARYEIIKRGVREGR
ncbi:MAG: hypothetical protein ACREYE_28785 [Gammaproteobacteria bacterium]